MESSEELEKLYDIKYGEIQAREIPQEYKQLALGWLKPEKADVILELGMGSGDFVDFLRQHSDHVFGMDLNKDLLVAHPKEGTVAMNARKMGFKDASIDKSVSLHTLEHIPMVGEVLQELDRVTRQGGLSLHVFPNPHVHMAEGALTEAVRMTKNPFKIWKTAKRLHPIKLTPKILEVYLEGTNWRLERSESIHVPIEKGNSWAVLLRKQS